MQNRLDDQTLQIKQTYIFITIAGENYRTRLRAQHSPALNRHRKAVDSWFAYLIAKFINGIPIFIEPLHNPHRSLIDSSAEETCDRGIALIFDRQPQRPKLAFAITGKARVQIFKPDQLLAGAAAQTHRTITQLVHQVDVTQLE